MKTESKPTKIKLPPVRLDVETLFNIEELANKYYKKITFKLENTTHTYSFNSITEINSIKDYRFHNMYITFDEYPHPISINLSNLYGEIIISTDSPQDLGTAAKLKALFTDTSSIFIKLLYHNESIIFIPLLFACLSLISCYLFFPTQTIISISSFVYLLTTMIITIKTVKFPNYSIIYIRKKPLTFMQLIKIEKKTLIIYSIFTIVIAVFSSLLDNLFK